MKTIGSIIKEKRLENGWTQSQLARLIGVAQGTVNKWEIGMTTPRRYSLMSCARVFKCSMEDLTPNRNDLPSTLTNDDKVSVKGKYIDVDEVLKKLPDDLPYKASVKRVLIQAPNVDVEKALEKQKPKRVKFLLHFKDGSGGYCPNCNGTVEKRNTFLRRIKKENHCTWCGQSLDWGDYPIGKDGE